ncbi:MAG: hypothetical protein Tsb009_05750 [Planctomycetaceae bacterium]
MSLKKNAAQTSRRTFLKTSAASAVAMTASPLFLHAERKSGKKSHIVGTGAWKYEVQHDWGELPDHIKWGDTHGVAIDSAGLVYITHRNNAANKKGYTGKPMDAVVVFDSQGRFVRSFGKEFDGAGHGIDIRKEGNEEFLYLSYIQKGVVVKTTLKGEEVWRIGRPQKPAQYHSKRARYSPTNLAFAPDGGIYVGDGYGSHFVHQYDKNNNLVRVWGGIGKGKGQMRTPHGIWLDDRPGRKPSLVVADRANNRLQYFSLEGKHLGFNHDVSFPADIDIQGEIMLVADLHARITLFDNNNKVLAHLGYDPAWTKKVLANRLKLRRDPKNYVAGKFVHPHDACFDAHGNIIVAEWVPQGRIDFLRKVD